MSEEESKAAIEYLESRDYLDNEYYRFRRSRPYMTGERRSGLMQFKRDTLCPAALEEDGTCQCLRARPGYVSSLPWTERDERNWLDGDYGTGEGMRTADIPFSAFQEFNKTWLANGSQNTLIK